MLHHVTVNTSGDQCAVTQGHPLSTKWYPGTCSHFSQYLCILQAHPAEPFADIILQSFLSPSGESAA